MVGGVYAYIGKKYRDKRRRSEQQHGRRTGPEFGVLGFFVYPGIVPGVLASRAGVFNAFHVQTAYGFGRLARTAKQHRGQNTQQGVTHIQHMNRNLRLPGCLYYAGLYKNNLCLA